ncbi:MAG: NAD-dependent malic enzyme [Deltaproteobacteria bacterium]|nr:NAD-dependent malic enzyme [Deltaproteobacteria bacterium]
MAIKQKLVRTLRFRNTQKIGVLAKLISQMSSLGADLGNIATVSVGELYTIRNISIIVNDEAHLKQIIDSVKQLPECQLEAVVDDVLEIHQGGKLSVSPSHPVKTVEDLSKVYTPGVASVCRLIKDDPSQAEKYTTIPKTVAIVTNGSRVLGLGNIGPVASMPVMEGKAALFAQFSGMHMLPILINTLDVNRFIDTVESISSTFAAIQLEDIRTPDCFVIEDALTRRLNIPVFHDDQHGTATVTLAALINATRLGGHDLKTSTVGQIGLGAAGTAIGRLIMKYSKKPVYGTDVNPDCMARFKEFGGHPIGLEELMKKCSVIVATTGIGGLIKPSWVQKGQVILALSNPLPEIAMRDALNAGAAFASDGSRVNNLLAYPGLLRGAVQARATKMVPEMFIAAALAIVEHTPAQELIPDPLDPLLHDAVTKAVAKAAIKAKAV